MKTNRLLLIVAIFAMVFTSIIIGCKTKLEPGGAYAPVTTNADGTITPTQSPNVALALADQTYQLAYITIVGISDLERDNRVALFKVSPKIKETLDSIRPTIVEVNLRWAKARKAYLQTPTPAGLDTIHLIISELDKILPIAQSQMSVITKSQSK